MNNKDEKSLKNQKLLKILEHQLVPEHIVLTDEETQELLKKYNITKEKLPLIKSTDPIVEIIGAKPGQVVKIIRKKSPAGEAISYRLVVK